MKPIASSANATLRNAYVSASSARLISTFGRLTLAAERSLPNKLRERELHHVGENRRCDLHVVKVVVDEAVA
jgi:hypothetical protein